MSWRKPKWALAFYRVFGSKLQGWADQIEALELPPELKKGLQTLADALPEDWSIQIMKWVVGFYKKNGPEAASRELKTRLRILAKYKLPF